MKSKQGNVGVVGAGISGLSAALSLSTFGIEVTVFERANNIRDEGVGIQLTPNATKSLKALGLLDEIIRKCFYPRQLVVNDMQSLKSLKEINLGNAMVKKYGFPYVTISRSVLHKALLEKCKKLKVKFKHGTAIRSVYQNEELVICENTNGQKSHFDYMCVCDGIRSQNNNLNQKNGLKTSGSVVFRKIYSNTGLVQVIQNNINVWMGDDCHLVSYPINSMGHINIVFAVNRKLVKKIMSISKKPEFLIDLLKIKNRTLIDLLENIQDWKKWPLYNTGFITKVNHITEGRVLFMGDAAHPLYPHLAQGAAMALEDGRILFKLLKKNKGIYDETFQEFATSRFRRCQRMQIESQINGHIFQLGWPLRDIRNMFIKTLGSRLIDKSWIYKF